MNPDKSQPKDSLSTPVLFLIFNRPEVTQKVFAQIRKVKPKRLYIAADGPRESHPEDNLKCEQTRQIVTDSFDWDCEVKIQFREKNLGCAFGPYESINWFFHNEEQGIILEDDCLPTKSFFHFCDTLLSRYKHDERIMMISGLNLQENWNSTGSYHFCRFGGVWGWATWRRAWKGMDINLELWKDNEFRQLFLKKNFKKKYHKPRIALYNNILDQLSKNDLNVWDTQWTFHRLVNNGLCIIPAQNQIRNIGFSESATHTFIEPDWNPQRSFELGDITFNDDVVADNKYDEMHLRKTSNITGFKTLLLKKIKLLHGGF